MGKINVQLFSIKSASFVSDKFMCNHAKNDEPKSLNFVISELR